MKILKLNQFLNESSAPNTSDIEKEYREEIREEIEKLLSQYNCENWLYNIGFDNTHKNVEWIEIILDDNDWERLKKLSYFEEDAIKQIGNLWDLPYSFWTGDEPNEHTSFWLSNQEN